MEELVDTGLGDVADGTTAVWQDTPTVAPEKVTATVNQPEPTGLTPAGVQAAKSLVQLPKELTHSQLAALAREVAMDIKELHVVLKNYQLTQVQYDFLSENNDFFKQALRACTIEWHSALTTPERIKIEAAAILEDTMPRLGARMAAQAEGLPGVVEAAKLFAKIAGVGEREQNDRVPGERFTISINLGGDNKLIKDVTPKITIEGSASSLQENKEG